jgi:hypothetical protein
MAGKLYQNAVLDAVMSAFRDPKDATNKKIEQELLQLSRN